MRNSPCPIRLFRFQREVQEFTGFCLIRDEGYKIVLNILPRSLDLFGPRVLQHGRVPCSFLRMLRLRLGLAEPKHSRRKTGSGSVAEPVNVDRTWSGAEVALQVEQPAICSYWSLKETPA